MTETQLWEWMMDGKARGEFPNALATISKPITLRKWMGHFAEPEFSEVPLEAGTRVRVVMASRFGDVGITDDLEAVTGYHYRSPCVEGEVHGGKIKPAGLLVDIEKVE